MKKVIHGTNGYNTVIMNGMVTHMEKKERVTNITLTITNEMDYQEDVKIAFWNNEGDEFHRASMLADRLEKAKVSEGVHLIVRASEKDGIYTGRNFQYNILMYKDEEEREYNFISGIAVNPKLTKGKLTFGVPVGKDENMQWHNITVWDVEKHPKRAEQLYKSIEPTVNEETGKKAYKRICIQCSGNSHFHDMNTYVGGTYEVIVR